MNHKEELKLLLLKIDAAQNDPHFDMREYVLESIEELCNDLEWVLERKKQFNPIPPFRLKKQSNQFIKSFGAEGN